MFEIELDGKKREAKVTFKTAVLYEMEFHSDLTKDFFGKQVLAAKPEGTEDALTIDFTATNWNVVMKVLWAALKTVDPSLPGFERWASETEGGNLWWAAEALSVECADCFFRPDSAGEDEDGR